MTHLADRPRLARSLVRLYPRCCRERYGEEMLAFIDDTGLDWRRAADVLLGAGRERAKLVLVWPGGDSVWRFFGAYVLLTGVLGCVIALIGAVAGVAARNLDLLGPRKARLRASVPRDILGLGSDR